VHFIEQNFFHVVADCSRSAQFVCVLRALRSGFVVATGTLHKHWREWLDSASRRIARQVLWLAAAKPGYAATNDESDFVWRI